MPADLSESSKLLERYHEGDCKAVWRDLLLAGDLSRDSLWNATNEKGARLPEIAWKTATETMARVRRNLQLIVERLQADGYRFENTNSGTDQPIVPLIVPDEEFSELADWLESSFGGIPLSLRAFLTQVGDVNLLGRHPNWAEDFFRTSDGICYPDPLVVEFRFKRLVSLEEAKQHFFEEEDQWQVWKWDADGDFTYPFGLDFAPDQVTKAGFSGGSPYRFLVSDKRADGLVDLDGPTLFFVEYLRRTILEYGGFFGFRQIHDQENNRLIGYLKDGLEPF